MADCSADCDCAGPSIVAPLTEADLRRILREELRNEFFRQLSEDPDLTDPEVDIEC